MSFFGNLLGGRARKCAPVSIPTVAGGTGADDLMREELVMIFKHSTSCPVSWAAHSQVSRFLQDSPEAPVRMVSVIKERPLSQQIAAATGVRHESPQLIVLRRGEVLATASHGEINRERLEIMFQNAAGVVPASVIR